MMIQRLRWSARGVLGVANRRVCAASYTQDDRAASGAKRRATLQALRTLQAEVDALAASDADARRALDDAAADAYARYVKRRAQIVEGTHEPTEAEVHASDLDVSAYEEVLADPKLDVASRAQGVGVRGFWPAALTSYLAGSKIVTDDDVELLSALHSFSVETWGPNKLDPYGGNQPVVLKFAFGPNDFLYTRNGTGATTLMVYLNADSEVERTTMPKFREGKSLLYREEGGGGVPPGRATARGRREKFQGRARRSPLPSFFRLFLSRETLEADLAEQELLDAALDERLAGDESFGKDDDLDRERLAAIVTADEMLDPALQGNWLRGLVDGFYPNAESYFLRAIGDEEDDGAAEGSASRSEDEPDRDAEDFDDMLFAELDKLDEEEVNAGGRVDSGERLPTVRRRRRRRSTSTLQWDDLPS